MSEAGSGTIIAALLGVLWAPTIVIGISFMGLLQFKLMYGALSSLFHDKHGGLIWQRVQPVLSDFIHSMEASLGPASRFNPSLTHVLLVGVILAIVFGPLLVGNRVRSSHR